MTTAEELCIKHEMEILKLRSQNELELAKHKALLAKYVADLQAKENKRRTITMNVIDDNTISTEVILEDGRKLTVSMDKGKCRKIDPDIHEIFYDVPCMASQQGAGAAPRSLKQLQDCSCPMCATACATILKWRVLR